MKPVYRSIIRAGEYRLRFFAADRNCLPTQGQALQRSFAVTDNPVLECKLPALKRARQERPEFLFLCASCM